jgi:Flp pilus assembly protein TadD
MDGLETAKQFFVEGLQLLEANNFQAAEIQFARSLELIPDRVSTLNNLSATKIRLKKFAEAEDFALRAIALEEKSPEAWANLGSARTATKRHEEALRAYDRALNYDSSYAKAWLNKAMTLLELKSYDEALLACDQALKLNLNQYEIAYTKSLTLNELKRPEEAQKMYLKSLEMRMAASPLYSTERHSTQKADVLVINPDPYIDDSLISFEDLQLYAGNYPIQLAEHFREDFHFSFVFKDHAASSSARNQIPQPDFVINNNANGELILSEGSLSGLTELVDGFGVPAVNHPAKVVQTARDVAAKLLSNTSGVVVPRTTRFSSVGKTYEELAREIEDQYEYPLITRSVTFQQGVGMTKVDSRDMLVEVLASGCPEEFFVTEFVDSRGGNKFFRKIRAAIVNDEIVIVRVDYDTNWNVHGRKSAKRVPFYLENAYLLDLEKQICADPEKELGRPAIQSLHTIRDQLPLDVFGMDFDVDADGSVVFYEANATMNLFSTAQKEVPNPKEADDHLKLAFQRYLTCLVARR